MSKTDINTDFINKSNRDVYASYEKDGKQIIIKITTDEKVPIINVLASTVGGKLEQMDIKSYKFIDLTNYYEIEYSLDDWVASYEVDCSKSQFNLSDVIELIPDTNSMQDNNDYTKMTTTYIDKDTYTTEVSPLNLSEITMKKQAEYTANAVGSALEKLQNTKKNKSKSKEESASSINSVEYTEDDFNKVVQGVNVYELSRILHIKGALLLVSPPGTGKTTTAIELAKYIQGETDSSRVEVVSFNQTTSYDDFIGGYKKSEDGDWELQKGTFFKLCDKASSDIDNKYILIIDEINRANTESVLGEALSGISKRGEKFKTNIGINLVVPENLYIIATMNSTDSSITSLDTALVDRFSVYSMSETDLDVTKLNSINGIELVSKAIKDINRVLAQDIYKGKDNKIGNRALYTNYSSTKDLILVVKYDIQPKVEAKLNTLTKQAQDEIRGIFNRLIKELEEAY